MLRHAPNPIRTGWKPWTVQLTDELQPKKWPVRPIPTDALERYVVEYTMKNKTIFVQGSPSCGKTSLMNQIKANAAKYGVRRVFMLDWAKPYQVLRQEFADLHRRARPRAECLFLVDEAQAMIENDVCSPGSLFKAGFRVAYFGKTTRVSDRFCSPAELQPHTHWMHAPSLDRKEVRRFAADVLQYHGCDPDLAMKLGEQAFDYVGASMGFLIAVLKLIVDGEGKFPTPNSLLLPEHAPRVVLGGDSAAWRHNPAKVEVAQRLLAVGNCTITMGSPESERQLLRTGFLAPVRDLSSDEPIVKMPKDTTTATWAHSWQPLYCRLCEPPILPLPTVPRPDATLKTPIDVLLRFLPKLCIESLVPAIVPGCASFEASEYNFRLEFVAALKSALPQATTRNEARTTSSDDAKGRLDFMVKPFMDPKDPTWWAYEVVVSRGAQGRLDEHLKRFAKGGKCDGLSWSDYLVIDCRTGPLVDRRMAAAHGKVATISPHISEGWNIVVLDYGGRRVYVPRDGVPRYVADFTVEHPVVDVAVKLVPTALEVTVTDGRATFTVKPEHPDVMALKKAIKQYMPSLSMVDPDSIIVKDFTDAASRNGIKDPNGQKVLGDKEPLRSGVEYVFELPSGENDLSRLPENKKENCQ